MTPRGSEETYRKIFDLNPQPMWVSDLETKRFLAANRAALSLYGYAAKEFLQLTERQIVGGDEGGWERHRRKDESTCLVRAARSRVEYEGTPAQLVVIAAVGGDSAELEKSLAECRGRLEIANKELETFSYSISHDLRAPLRHIDGFSKALLDDYGTKFDAEGKEYLERICQATHKMGQLIDDVLKLARVVRTELDRQKVNVSTVAQVVALELKHTDPARPVEFRIEAGLTAFADPRLVRILLENLLGNAWKFTGKKQEGVIEVGSRVEEGATVFFVRDNGAGFDMAYAGKLFTLFHRLHRADEFEGSGVGLAVAHRIVGRHGGRIWAESSPGSGATFYFTL